MCFPVFGALFEPGARKKSLGPSKLGSVKYMNDEPPRCPGQGNCAYCGFEGRRMLRLSCNMQNVHGARKVSTWKVLRGTWIPVTYLSRFKVHIVRVGTLVREEYDTWLTTLYILLISHTLHVSGHTCCPPTHGLVFSRRESLGTPSCRVLLVG